MHACCSFVRKEKIACTSAYPAGLFIEKSLLPSFYSFFCVNQSVRLSSFAHMENQHDTNSYPSATSHPMQLATSLLNEGDTKPVDCAPKDGEKVKPLTSVPSGKDEMKPAAMPCLECHQVAGTMKDPVINWLTNMGTYVCSGCGETRVLFEPPSNESSPSNSENKCSDDEEHGSDSDAIH